MKAMKRGWVALLTALCLAFAVRALLLIDATALWGDELYSVGKSFQPSFSTLLALLREDTHPPGYYTLLWFWGYLVGQSPVSLRALSWLAYLAGGWVIVQQSTALAEHRGRSAAMAALLVFCSPYPIRFAIEGKSYALLVLLVALLWWSRRANKAVAYGFFAGLAGLTHFYGLFLVLATAVWDGWQRRWRLAIAAVIAALPALTWIAYAADYLFSSRPGSWIGPPDYALFEETLARALGLWPLPKLALIVVLLLVLRRWGGLRSLRWPERHLLDASGLIPSLLMVAGVVAVSFYKPMAFSRYFVVLLPSVVPVVAVLVGRFELNRLGRGCGLAVLVVLLASWWGPGFAELDAGIGGVREKNQFRLISQRTSGLEERYSPSPRLFNLSDRMEAAMGRITLSQSPWKGRDALSQRLEAPDQAQLLWLASSGSPSDMARKLKPLRSQVEQAGYRCEPQATDLTHAVLLQCQSESSRFRE